MCEMLRAIVQTTISIDIAHEYIYIRAKSPLILYRLVIVNISKLLSPQLYSLLESPT